jgi:hypothetical protein
MPNYNNNIGIIQLKRPRLFEMFKADKYLKKDNKISKVESVEAKDGTRILVVDYEGASHRLNSIYNPIKESERWVAQYDFNNHKSVISLFGFGNGILVRKLIENLRSEDRIIIYEPSIELFSHVVEQYDITDILDNDMVSITVNGVNDYEFHSLIHENVDWVNICSQLVCIHPVYDKLFLYEHKEFLEEIKNNNTRAILNRNTAAKMGKAMIKNVARNFRYIVDSYTVNELCDFIPKDIPVIIVAAGPSLDKNISTLKLAKGKSIIMATDRALDYLFQHGIEPDFIVTLDAIKPLKYFSNREDINIPLFCKLESNYEILDFHKGRKVWYDIHPYLRTIYEDLEKSLVYYNSGGSVATAAFSICVGLGINTIVLMGQDLAYSGTLTHAGGIVGEGENETNIAGLVEDINGNMVPTRHDWKIFLSWYEDAITQRPEIEVIDATEGGAKIKGTKIMNLKDAIGKYCISEFNCKDVLENIQTTLEVEDTARIWDYINQSIKDLDTIKEKVEQSAKYCNELIIAYKNNKLNTNYNQKLNKQISINNELVLNKPAYKLIDTFIADTSAEHLMNIYQFSDNEEDNTIKTYKNAQSMYQAMMEASLEIKDLLIALLKDVKFK